MKILKFNEFILEKRSDRVVSAKDLVEMDFGNNLEFQGKWNIMFGNPAPNFSMILTGAPSSGKTTLLLEFAFYLAENFGKVLYISTEEYGSSTLQNKLKDVIKKSGEKIDGDKYKLPERLDFAKGMTDLTDYDFIFIDSVSDVNMDLVDYKELSDVYADKAFISVLQFTKGSKGETSFRGSLEWEHEVDIYAMIDSGVVQVFKNRYGAKSKYDYFNNESIRED